MTKDEIIAKLIEDAAIVYKADALHARRRHRHLRHARHQLAQPQWACAP